MKKGLSLLVSSVMFFCISDCMANHVTTCQHSEKDMTVNVTLSENEKLENSVSIIETHGDHDLIGNYQNLDNLWDGHMSGLMTAKGVSVKYESHFGVLKKVRVQAFMTMPTSPDYGWIRTYYFDECTTNRG